MDIKLFYSWQSDLLPKCNRFFIEKCLKQSIMTVNKIESSKEKLKHLQNEKEIILDQATRNTKGAIDIATTVFNKIERASMFAADVSLIGEIDKKYYPNSNVLTELGFASSKIGWENMILFFNRNSGSPENLPFDIRGRRLFTFNCKENVTSNNLNKEKERICKSLNIILSEQIEMVNPIQNDPISKIYVYLWNRLSGLSRNWKNLIESIYKEANIEMDKESSFVEQSELFKKACEKVNSKSPPSNMTYIGRFKNWFNLISYLKKELTSSTVQIFQFQNIIHIDVIERISRAEIIANQQLWTPKMDPDFIGNSDLSHFSSAIIEVSSYLVESSILFREIYSEHSKENMNYYKKHRKEREKIADQ